jgi:adenine-specific DNA-methyltransferase
MNNNTDLGHSPDALAQRKAELLALLAQSAPELISDQQLNVAKLQELLGDDRLAPQEHYELTWAGKTAARREIQKTSSHTLRPDAKNPDKAQHLLIEGENLEVLRVLQKSYYGKVKMIYIDPPYNTGNDSFVYPDDYSETLDEYQRRTGEKNEAGFLNKQSLWKKNSKESGQYHSAWLSMMYPRLYLARNLLRDDGVIFISIDDNEAANLKLLCDEVFGIESFVGNVAWKKTSGDNKPTFAFTHDNILIYSKRVKTFPRVQLNSEQKKQYFNPDSDLRGDWAESDYRSKWSKSERPNLYYAVFNQKSKEIIFPDSYSKSSRVWACDENTHKLNVENKLIWWGADGKGREPKKKRYLAEHEGTNTRSVWLDAGTNDEAGQELRDLFGGDYFDNPKPLKLIKKIVSCLTKNDELVLDFFSGSGTTAQSVIELNLEDQGRRQSISVQMPEVLDEDSEAYKAGYRTIADITRARIDKVIAKLKAEHPDATADLACAHFTLAPSNFKVWRGDANTPEALREQLALFQTAEKPIDQNEAVGGAVGGAGGEAGGAHKAMLAELLLKHGLGALGVHAICAPIKLAGATVHRVLMPDNRTMWLCFDPYTEALKTEITQAAPAQVVMLNSCFVGAKADELLANLQLELSGLRIGLTVI